MRRFPQGMSRRRVWQVRASAAEREVLRRLHGFALEAATPLECMLFLSELKKRLNGE